jgi:hypothetical protein
VRFIADFDGILWMILMSFFGNPKVWNWAKSVWKIAALLTFSILLGDYNYGWRFRSWDISSVTIWFISFDITMVIRR